MAGILYEDFLLKLKNLYATKDYTNVQIKITEECDSYVQSDLNLNSNLTSAAVSYVSETQEFIPIILEAHAVILYMNSMYFEKQLVNHQQGSSKIDIMVKTGQAKYLEIIIAAFYDEKVLHGRNMSELLDILELAKIYANDVFLVTVLKYLEEMDVDVNMYNMLLTNIWKLGDGNHITQDIIAKCKTKYVGYLNKLFSPIEETYNEHRKFMELEYASLLFLLQGDKVLSISENSILTFIVLWLKHDSNRQTASVIEGLLGSIRIEFLTFNFLYSTIKIDHNILNKWSGYRDWFYHNLGALGMTGSLKQSKHPSLDYKSSRNIEFGIHKWYKDAANTNLNACRWSVQMTPEKPGEKFGPTDHLLVHDGYQFSPKFINIIPKEGDESILNMNLCISCTGSLADVRFVVGIVPAHRDYDITSNKYFASKFAQLFLKWTKPLAFNSDIQIIDFWTISKDFVGHVNEHGLYVLLLPVTDEEYQILSKVKLRCRFPGHDDSLTVIGCCTGFSYCHPTSKSKKIHLTNYCNYSL